MDTGMSAADLAAISDGGFGGSNMAWWIVVLMIFGWGGFGGFGNNSASTTTDVVGATVQRGFDNTEINNKLNSIGNGIADLGYSNQSLINGIEKTVMQGNYDNAMNMTSGFAGINQALNTGFDSVNANINNLSYQMQQCCCQIKTQILEDRLADTQNQLSLAQTAAANATQSQYILGQLGKFYSNAPITPYYTYGTTVG